MGNDQDEIVQDGLCDWVIEDRESRYTLECWLLLIVFAFASPNWLLHSVFDCVSPEPVPADITYTVRNKVSGQRWQLTLCGHHSATDLAAAIRCRMALEER